MSSPETGERHEPAPDGALHLYCLGTLMADEASRGGFRDFARSLETALDGLLSGLSREDQRQALRLSYEISMGSEEPAQPRLRLVYSRD